MHHRTIQINHQPGATVFQSIIVTFVYSWTCFGRFPAHHLELSDCSGSLWFYLCIGWPAWPRTQHDYHHDTMVKPEATTAVIELLMMGGKTPEMCWTVNKCQDNKLKNCCIRLVIYLNLNVKLRCQKVNIILVKSVSFLFLHYSSSLICVWPCMNL